ncbi:FMN-binding protein [Microlunatus capsulatus]|uniref:Uncharacterized protein with FMN-binding domain n=1 Tax=Microlunatus capsulatus TaxID=99117 RepID=A0ABS4Z923_9ACTN|nr:FMN-binding protein [Microlunatus capsulatus]MBP2417464.1 uncharacterized protein with FMN-binding domain [Microlunatus capsulatus]
MRRIVLWLAATVTVVVLLFSYHTSTDAPAATPPAATASSTPGGSSSATAGAGAPPAPGTSPTTTAPSSPPASGSPSTASGGGGTYTGDVAQTRWGPVQVEITAADGRLTAVQVVEYPTENPRDQEINARAIPTLVDETLSAQSAEIDMVSGATVTSEGYLQSLQSALDQAGI